MGSDSSRNTPENNSKKTGLLLLWENMPRIALLATVILIIFLMVVIGGEKKRLEQEKAAAQAQGRKPVNTVLLEIKPDVLLDSINLPGVVEPWIKLELMAKIMGTIEEVFVKEGDSVKKGDILARIEKDDYQIALDSARTAYELSESDYQRGKAMVDKKVISVADLERLKTKMTTDRIAVENAELMLSRCDIKAPMDGVVSRLNAKVGLFLSVGDPVGQMLQIDRVKGVVGIPESDVDAVRKINGVDITIQALGDRKVTGKKYFFASSPDTVARIYKLELEIDNPDGSILPGMFLRANVVKQTVQDAIAIPLYSLITRNDEQFVFVARNGVVEKRHVKLGIIDNWMVQIIEGLSAGEQIVVEGHRDVEDGQEIEVISVITDPGSVKL